MMPRLPERAVVALAALDLRRRPDHRSEMRSQLLLGEVVRPLERSRDERWWRVENLVDRYAGWVRTWGLVPASRRRASSWLVQARVRVVAACTLATTRPGGGALVSPLLLNGRAIPGPARAGHRRLELPDGRRGWVETEALARVGQRGVGLADRVRALLGCPYLWGGRSPLGFDCSGFTQQLLFEQGVLLPRDANEQYETCRPLHEDEPAAPGDLLFFGPRRGRIAHVGVALGGGYFAHSRGRVQIGSVEPGNPLRDTELLEQFRGVRRPVAAPSRRRPFRRQGESA